MPSDDTIKLLKECNAGVKTAVSSFDEVIDHIQDPKLKNLIVNSRMEHEKIGDETHKLLVVNEDDDKEGQHKWTEI